MIALKLKLYRDRDSSYGTLHCRCRPLSPFCLFVGYLLIVSYSLSQTTWPSRRYVAAQPLSRTFVDAFNCPTRMQMQCQWRYTRSPIAFCFCFCLFFVAKLFYFLVFFFFYGRDVHKLIIIRAEVRALGGARYSVVRSGVMPPACRQKV